MPNPDEAGPAVSGDKIGKTPIGSPNCPCIVAERPKCGRKDCWHFGFNQSDCELCGKTGFVKTSGPAVEVTRVDHETAAKLAAAWLNRELATMPSVTALDALARAYLDLRSERPSSPPDEPSVTRERFVAALDDLLWRYPSETQKSRAEVLRLYDEKPPDPL